MVTIKGSCLCGDVNVVVVLMVMVMAVKRFSPFWCLFDMVRGDGGE